MVFERLDHVVNMIVNINTVRSRVEIVGRAKMSLLYRMHSLNFPLVLTPTRNSCFNTYACSKDRVIWVPASLETLINYNNTLNSALIFKLFNIRIITEAL